MTTQQLLDKWQALDTDEQKQVLAFIDSLYCQKQERKSTSSLGNKLRKYDLASFNRYRK